MQLKKRFVQTFLAVLLCSCIVFTQSACGIVGTTPNPNKIVDTLEIISYAANAAVIAAPILESTGAINSAVAQIVVSAGQATATACDNAITEQESMDTNPQKIAKIISIFATVPVDTVGLPPQAAALISGISNGIQQLLRLLGQPALTKLAKDHPNTSIDLILTKYDRNRLNKIKDANKATMTKVAITRK